MINFDKFNSLVDIAPYVKRLDKSCSVENRDMEKEYRLYKKFYTEYVEAYIDEILRLKTDPDFVRDDTYNGIKTDHHIVFKLKCDERGSTRLVSADGNRGYEFLIEFDLNDTAYGIYYGCRGLILGGDQEEEINNFISEWDELSYTVRTVLNNTFENIDFVKERFQPTNNANNRTFWPFWISLYKGEDVLKVAGTATKLIFRAYRIFLQNDRKHSISERKKKAVDFSKTRYTIDAYDQLMKKIEKEKPRGREILEHFLERATQADVGLLEEDLHYEKCWRVKELSNDAFACVLSQLSLQIDKSRDPNAPPGAVLWSYFTPIILSSEGRTIDSLRQSYGRFNNEVLNDTWKKYEREAEKIINLIFSK